MTTSQISEAQFQDWLIGEYSMRHGRHVGGLLGAYGWMTMHPEQATIKGYGDRQVHKTPAAKGYPDVTAVRNARVRLLELKTETGKVRPDQRMWLNAAAGIGGDVVWDSKGEIPGGVAVTPTGSFPLSMLDPTAVRRAVLVVAVVRPRHRAWLEKAMQ